MFFLGTLPLLVSKIWGTTFHNIQVEDDEWVNSFYSMGNVFWESQKITKTSMGGFMHDCLLESYPAMRQLQT